MKRLINILLIIFGISFVLFVTSNIITYKCPFKLITGISCLGCGLTRSFRAIFNLDLYNAFYYNILGIPLFIIGIIIIVSLIKDIIKNDNKTINCIFNILSKYYIFIIILLIISMIINNIRGI